MQVDKSEGMINLGEVLTFIETADKQGLADEKTIRKAMERRRFKPHEIKKSGDVWLTIHAAMQRVFGGPRTPPSVLYYIELYEDTRERLECFFEEAGFALQRGDMIPIVESREHPERVFCILKMEEELEGLQQRLKYFMKSQCRQVRKKGRSASEDSFSIADKHKTGRFDMIGFINRN